MATVSSGHFHCLAVLGLSGMWHAQRGALGGGHGLFCQNFEVELSAKIKKKKGKYLGKVYSIF